ncbi:metalloregulator ArsR/SmtB family transcription factor [Myceligenerans halotolerans]
MTTALELTPTTSTPSGACCAPMVREAIEAEPARELARVFKALSDPTRVQLVSIIAAHDGGEACVCDLTEPVGLSQPTVSHHLKILVDAGFLTRTQRGKWAYYGIVPGSLDRIAESLTTAAPLRG